MNKKGKWIMKASKIDNLKSGVLKVFQYNKDGFESFGIRVSKKLIYDIYHNTNFDKDICIIVKVIPKDNNSISDVIKEYISKSWGNNTLLIAQAGTLSMIPEMAKINDGINAINSEREELYEAGFYNIILNQIARTCGNPELFIYMNDLSKKFIENNIGTNEDNKLINRFK